MAHGHEHSFGSDEPFVALTAADEEYRETPPGSSYEHTDASVWAITKFGLWLVASAVVIHIGLGLMYALFIEQAKKTEDAQPARYPLAVNAEPRVPPAPRLQQFPRTEMYEVRRDQDAKLNSYGWVNKDAGTVHIPIDDAMKRVLENGSLQSRPQDAAQPGETPGMIPADSSSGRTLERRRQ
jgi:hypothetical protein